MKGLILNHLLSLEVLMKDDYSHIGYAGVRGALCVLHYSLCHGSGHFVAWVLKVPRSKGWESN